MTQQNAGRERLGPIAEDKMTEAQRKAAAELSSGPRGSVRGPFTVMLRSPELMTPLQKVGEYLRFRSALDRRIAEMATLIAARDWTQTYEWHAHYPLALKAGLKQEIAQAIGEGRRPRGMAEDEEALYDLLTEAFRNKSVSDATYDRALKIFGEQNLVDLLALGGYYGTLAMLMNVARTPLPEGAQSGIPHFPS